MIIPLLTQYMFHDPKALRFALLVIPVLICPSSALVLLSRRRAFLGQIMSLEVEAQSPSRPPREGRAPGALASQGAKS